MGETLTLARTGAGNLDLGIEELEETIAPGKWFWYGVAAGAGFAIGFT